MSVLSGLSWSHWSIIQMPLPVNAGTHFSGSKSRQLCVNERYCITWSPKNSPLFHSPKRLHFRAKTDHFELQCTYSDYQTITLTISVYLNLSKIDKVQILKSQFSQLWTKRSRLNKSSSKHSALSYALDFYNVFSCPSSHIFKTGRHIGTEIYGKSMDFFGGRIADVSPAKSTAVPSFRFLCGGRVRQ